MAEMSLQEDTEDFLLLAVFVNLSKSALHLVKVENLLCAALDLDWKDICAYNIIASSPGIYKLRTYWDKDAYVEA